MLGGRSAKDKVQPFVVESMPVGPPSQQAVTLLSESNSQRWMDLSASSALACRLPGGLHRSHREGRSIPVRVFLRTWLASICTRGEAAAGLR